MIILTIQLHLHNNRKLITFSSWLTPAALVRVTAPWSTKINLHNTHNNLVNTSKMHLEPETMLNGLECHGKEIGEGYNAETEITSPHQAGVVLILIFLEKRQSISHKCTRKFSFMANCELHHTYIKHQTS